MGTVREHVDEWTAAGVPVGGTVTTALERYGARGTRECPYCVVNGPGWGHANGNRRCRQVGRANGGWMRKWLAINRDGLMVFGGDHPDDLG